MLLMKGWHSMRKRGAFFVLGLFALLALFAGAYIARVPIAAESDYTMVVGLVVLAFLETIIRCGIIQVNSNYAKLFTHSSLSMRIIDAEKRATLSSASAVWYDYDTFSMALAAYPQPAVQGEDTLLFAAPIVGGYALWQEDITSLNRLHYEIRESISKLEAANELLSKEEAIERAAHEEFEKTRLMEQLESEIASHAIKLSAMIEQLENAADQPKALARITLLLCFVKRRCNLFFREKEARDLPADELTVYFDELAEIAGFSGVQTIVTSELRTLVPVRHATLMYDLFYNVVYWATWTTGQRMLVHLGTESGNTVLRLLPSEDAASFRMEKSLKKSISQAGGTYEVKDLDDSYGFSLALPHGEV
jgi:hypothetical protein